MFSIWTSGRWLLLSSHWQSHLFVYFLSITVVSLTCMYSCYSVITISLFYLALMYYVLLNSHYKSLHSVSSMTCSLFSGYTMRWYCIIVASVSFSEFNYSVAFELFFVGISLLELLIGNYNHHSACLPNKVDLLNRCLTPYFSTNAKSPVATLAPETVGAALL